MAEKPHSTQNGSATQHMASSVNQTASGVYSLAQRSLDRVLPPSSRQDIYDRTHAFASTRPVLFSFLLILFLLSFLPVLLFTTFSLTLVFLTLSSALLFSLFWIGAALLLLVPTLLVTFSLSVFVWAWAVGSFLVARWFYSRVPASVTGGLNVKAAGKEVTVVKDENRGTSVDVQDE